MKYGMYYGCIQPVQATEDMTIEVGQRLGKLFTYEDSAVLPDPQNNYDILMIKDNEWIASGFINDKLLSLFLTITTTRLREAAANALINTTRAILIGGNENV